MKSKSVLALFNQETGEIGNVSAKLPDSKYTKKGHKMYNYGFREVVKNFTKDEAIRIIDFFDNKLVDYHNLLMPSFLELTKSMDSATRSRFKRKLIDNMVIQEYNKRLMLNPYIFLPRGDANIRNSRYLTQKVWEWLFMDKDTVSEEIMQHAEHMFGKLISTSAYIKVGSKEYAKIINKPKSCE